MKKSSLAAALLPLCATLAHANDSSGSSALALAGLVAEHATGLTHHQRQVLAKFLAGHTTVTYPAGAKITISADSIACRASNVAIVSHSCELKFGATTRTFAGRKAHELFATLIEAGVPGDGAAGSSFESLSALACIVDPNEVKQNAGGGATCTFAPGP